MNIIELKKEINDFMNDSGLNNVDADIAFRPDLVGMKMYDEPLVGICYADDEFIKKLEVERDVIEQRIFAMTDSPQVWLPEAASIISVFLPFTEQVKASNHGGDMPSDEWLHARIEGQGMINALAKHIVAVLTDAGYPSMAPSLDKRFKISGTSDRRVRSGQHLFSNWSERHIAFATGLGTFSLSDSFITKKGAAGRFTSVITSMMFPENEYSISAGMNTDPYGNCSQCGACIKNCPVGAITFEHGHDHGICFTYLESTRVNPPYYGCGKCQTNTPCESRAPKNVK